MSSVVTSTDSIFSPIKPVVFTPKFSDDKMKNLFKNQTLNKKEKLDRLGESYELGEIDPVDKNKGEHLYDDSVHHTPLRKNNFSSES